MKMASVYTVFWVGCWVVNRVDLHEFPVHLENADVGVGKGVEECGRHVEIAVTASRAKIHNGSGGRLAVGYNMAK